MALTPKQRRFVDEYLVDLNATQAAIRAGYKHPGIGRQLITIPDVSAAIEAGRAALSRRTEVTQDRVIRELAAVAFSDATVYDCDDAGRVTLREGAADDAPRALASVKRKRRVVPGGDGACIEEVEFRLWNKVEALKLLGQHLDMFKEKTPLEQLLASLPPEFARGVREALAAAVSGAGPATGGAGVDSVAGEPGAADAGPPLPG
jgi:phage terminase small subunit